MIASPDRTVAISSLGWVDKDALWRFDAAAGEAANVPLGSGARYLSVHDCRGDRFAVAHHFDGVCFRLTAHPFDDPSRVLARLDIGEHGITATGDAGAWNDVPALYVAFLKFPPWRDYVLVRVRPGGAVSIGRFAWFDATYDQPYQSVCDVAPLPDGSAALVSVSRCSDVIVHDLESGDRRDAIRLAGRLGNPRLQLRPGAQEIWASDYDTIVAIDARTLRVKRRKRLQDAPFLTQQFIGEYWFGPDSLCLVARPFGGDLIAINADRLTIAATAATGAQPLEGVMLAGGDIVARDWQSGRLLRGRLS